MKLHLPFALLAAVVSAVAYADEPVTFDNSKPGHANVTIGENADDLSGYYMYGIQNHTPVLPSHIGGAASYRAETIEANDVYETFDSATITMKGGTGLYKLIGQGVIGNVVKGDTSVVVEGGQVTYVIGGTDYTSKSERGFMHNSDCLSIPNAAGNGNFYMQYKSNYNSTTGTTDLTKEKQNISITITGGKIGQIMGGHNSGSNMAYVVLKDAIAADKEDGGNRVERLMESKPWSVSGDVSISVEGGEIDTSLSNETKAIAGAGGSGNSVDGTVFVSIKGQAYVKGDIFAGASNVYSEVGSTCIIIDASELKNHEWNIEGNVYGGSDGSGSPKIEGGIAPTVKNDTNITIAGGTIKGSVYGAGIGDLVEGDTTITLLGGTITGGVYGGGTDDTSVVKGEKILYVGSAEQEFTGTVGWVEGFTQVIVGKDSTLKMTSGNVFAVNNQIITLTSANLLEAALSGGAAIVGENGLTLTLLAGERLQSGKYKVVELRENSKLRATAPAGPQGWEEGNVTFTSDSIAGFDDLVWEGSTLYLIYKQWNVDAAIVSNWGVFKSSQAFTGTLWGNRSNAVVLDAPAAYDGKGAIAVEAPVAKTLAWGTVYGQSGRISGAGANYSLYGAAIGAERQFGSMGSSIGVAFGYDWGKVNPFTTTSADQETWHAALYGRVGTWKAGKGMVSVDWSAACGDTTTEHNDIAGDWSQNSWQLDLRATYAQALSERATASVFAGVQYYTHDDATVGDLHISSLQNLRLMAGAGLSYAATARTNVYGQASVYCDAMRHNPHVDANGACFKGTNPGRIGGVLSVGADYAITEQWSLRGGYSFDVAEDSTEHNVNAGVQYSF